AAVEGDSFLQVQVARGPLTGIIRTKLVGSYNLPNVLAAITVGWHFGVPANKIKSAIEAYEPTNSRSQLIRRGNNTIVLDAYNANPSSMRLAIENFAKMPGCNKVLILGGMMELGVDTEKEHRDLLNLLKQFSWKAVILVGESFCILNPEYPCFLYADEAAEYMRSNPLENAQVLIKGSRSTQMEKVLEVF
ncbi:MAG: glutamate ligase domain-containing protein, partial [Ferruginibacter sp.]